jgi:DNA alkylation damage repair protein AlkB
VHHDTHAQPPEFIQRQHWKYQSMRRADIDNDETIQDPSKWHDTNKDQKDAWIPAGTIPAGQIQAACEAYAGGKPLGIVINDAPIYEHRDFPGLQVIPGLLPPETQVLFTSCLMHRDLADQNHKMNLQADYEIPYPLASKPVLSEPRRFDASFFTRERAATQDVLVPRNSDKHKQLNNEQFLYTKLRWLTLGEQYDWPTRSYAKHATPFPKDLATLVTGLFPHIRPESGVVLMYGAKDFMPVHRDVSEQCQRALASFSVGCDGIFIMARGEDDGQGDKAPRTVAIRVRSGDVVHLTGQARWAWLVH